MQKMCVYAPDAMLGEAILQNMATSMLAENINHFIFFERVAQITLFLFTAVTFATTDAKTGTREGVKPWTWRFAEYINNERPNNNSNANEKVLLFIE